MTPEQIAARAYFNAGRCSGHYQFNGRYCRHVAGPERWCIFCAGYMLLDALEEKDKEIARLRQDIRNLEAALASKRFPA